MTALGIALTVAVLLAVLALWSKGSGSAFSTRVTSAERARDAKGAHVGTDQQLQPRNSSRT